MGTKNNSMLFYTCSLIEFIGRTKKKKRKEVVGLLGRDILERIYEYADVLHCEPIEKVAAEFIEECQIKDGIFDNEADCKYNVPDYWTIGEVYERLIEDSYSTKIYWKEFGMFIILGLMIASQITTRIFIISSGII